MAAMGRLNLQKSIKICLNPILPNHNTTIVLYDTGELWCRRMWVLLIVRAMTHLTMEARGVAIAAMVRLCTGVAAEGVGGMMIQEKAPGGLMSLQDVGNRLRP